MTAVEHLYAEPKRESASLRRIRLLSLPFELVFALSALAVLSFFLLLAGLALFVDSPNLRIGPEGGWLGEPGDPYPPGTIAISDLPLASRLGGVVAAALIQGSLAGALFCLYRLFSAYRRGHVFAQPSIAWMHRAGMCLVAFAFMPGVMQPLVQALGLLDRQWFQAHNLVALIVGGALFVLASVIALGREIEKEGEGYI